MESGIFLKKKIHTKIKHFLQLIYHPYLSNLGMAFNTMLQMVICIDCNAAISSTQVAFHISSSHGNAKMRIKHAELAQALQELNAQESFDIKSLESPCKPIEGLAAPVTVLVCPQCPHMRSTQASMNTHFWQVHNNLPAPKNCKTALAQQLHPGSNSPYFQVFSKQKISTPHNHTVFLENTHSKRIKIVENFDLSKVDPRQVTPWLHATKWHAHVAPYNHDHLWSLVQPPSRLESELQFLGTVINAYTTRSNKEMDTLSTLARQVINSPNPK